MVIKKTTSNNSINTNDKYRREKISEINACLERKEVNLWHLRELCLSKGGLINAELRRKSWHKLTGINRTCLDISGNSTTFPLEETGVSAVDLEIISRDAGRAVYFRYKSPKLESETSEEKKSPMRTISNDSDSDSISNPSLLSTADMKSGLKSVIVSSIARSNSGEIPRLHYYQGFHDVASVILANISRRPELAACILHKIARSHLRDATREDFSGITCFLEIAFYPLLQVLDEELHDYLIFRELGPTAFLTWIITLFAHDIHDSSKAGRLFDAFLASHPIMPLYLSVALLVHQDSREKIFETEEDDPAMLQCIVTGLASALRDDFDSDSNGFTIQDMIGTAISLMSIVPPESLLRLAMKYDLGQSETLLQRGGVISLFKAPPSWAIAATAPSDWMQRKERRSLSKKSSSLNVRASVMGKSEILGKEKKTVVKSNRYPNAKIASGVSSLMAEVANTRRKKKRTFDINRATPVLAARNLVGFIKITLGIKKTTRRKRIVESRH